jgi:hypothetical protein
MVMKLEGTYTFDAPRDEVWKALMDPDILKAIMPGCETLEEVGPDEYQAAMAIKVGPVQGKFQGNVKLSDLNEPESYTMQVDGKGPAGFMKGVGNVRLEAQGAATVMHYGGDAQVGGRIASVGQRLLDSSAKALTRQSLDGLHDQIKARLQPQVEASPTLENNGTGTPQVAPAVRPPKVQPPSQTEFALGVAKNMVEDLIPPERRPAIIAGGVVMVLLLLFLNWRIRVIARRVANEVIERRLY